MNSAVESKDQKVVNQEMKLQVAGEIQQLVDQLDKKRIEAMGMGLNVSLGAANYGWREVLVCRVWEDTEYTSGPVFDDSHCNLIMVTKPFPLEAPEESETPLQYPVGAPDSRMGRVEFLQENNKRAYKLC